MASRSSNVLERQPRLSRFSLYGLLSLPKRICSPPPAVGKVRSFGLTPIFNVALDDVLACKHLPPLSLKDFEEWLLFVEGDARNFYFLLWLREYTARYERWIKKVRARETRKRGLPLPTSPTLALFFSRALNTFLSPDSPHALSLPPELASQPHFLRALSARTHPDPGVLTNLRAHAEDALRASLSRCVRAAFTNVGTYRATCGIVGGTLIVLGGCVPILATNFTRGDSRWSRLAIIPPLFLGLTVVLASMCGVCLMIYIFGDLRQLRHFELSRPPAPESDPAPSNDRAHEEGVLLSSIHAPELLGRPAPIQALTAPPKLPSAVLRFPSNTLHSQNTALTPIPESRLSVSACSSSGAEKMLSVSGISISPQMGTAYAQVQDRDRPRDSFISDADTSTDTRRSVPVYVYPDSDDDSYMGTRYGQSSFPHSQHHRARRGRKRSRNQYEYATEPEDGHRMESQDTNEDDDDDDDDDFNGHGIYISPPMPAPEVVAEDDPAVVSAALALLAHSKALAEQQLSSASPIENMQFYDYSYRGEEERYRSPPPTAPTSDAACVSCVSGTTSGSEASPISPWSKSSITPPQPQTATFIPSYTHSSSHTRSFSEASRHPNEPDIHEIGPFDFDALPKPHPPIPVSPSHTIEKRDYARSAYNDAEEGNGYGIGYPLELVSSRPCSGSVRAYNQHTNPITTPNQGLDNEQNEARTPSCSLCSLLPLSSTHSLSRSSLRTLFRSRSGTEKGGEESNIPGQEHHPRLPRVRPFGPTTAVHAPVVARAHWEVVVRAAMYAVLICVVVCTVVVACPVHTRV